MTVAEVAWAKLGMDAKGRAVQTKIEHILADHPFPGDIGWTGSHDNEVLRDCFATAATWPDLIKHNSHSSAPLHKFYGEFAESFDRPDGESLGAFEQALHKWHFFDVPVRAKPHGDGLVADHVPTPIATASTPAQVKNAFQALAWAQGVLKDGSSDPKMRAIALCWIEHLVGDLHQPLHCATLVTEEEPDGDEGGNQFPVPNADSKQNLHALWDDTLDPRGKKQSIEDEAQHLLVDLEPSLVVAAPETGPLDVDPAHWIQRGADLAATDAYAFDDQALRAALDEADNTSAEMKKYRTHVKALAEQRALLGGVRLAEILKKDL